MITKKNGFLERGIIKKTITIIQTVIKYIIEKYKNVMAEPDAIAAENTNMQQQGNHDNDAAQIARVSVYLHFGTLN